VILVMSLIYTCKPAEKQRLHLALQRLAAG